MSKNNQQDKRLNKIEHHVFNMNRELGEVVTLVKRHDKLLWIIITGVIVLILESFI